MTEGAYEIICQSCRSPVPSTAGACPSCGHDFSAGFQPFLPSSAALLGPTTLPTHAAAISAPTVARDSAFDRLAYTRAPTYGGFWIRVGAYLIDSILLLLPAIALRTTFGIVGSLIMLPVAWLYFATLESSGIQGTVGKSLLGLEVTDSGGRRVSFGRATGRYFAKILSGLTLGIGYLMVGLTSRKRGLHDVVAGTLVLRS